MLGICILFISTLCCDKDYGSEQKEMHVKIFFELTENQISLSTRDYSDKSSLFQKIMETPDEFKAIFMFSKNEEERITKEATLQTYEGKLVTEGIYLDIDKNIVNLEKVLIVDRKDPETIYFGGIHEESSIGKFSDQSRCLPIRVQINKPAEEINSTDSCIFIVDLANTLITNATDCGFKTWKEDYIYSFDIAYFVNTCGDPCDLLNPDYEKIHMGTKSQMKLQRQEFTENKWVDCGKSEWSNSDMDRTGLLSFDDYLIMDNTQERYILTLILDNKVEIAAAVKMERLLVPAYSGFWESPAGSGTNKGYLLFNLCDNDLTKFGFINETAKWPFEVTVPKICNSDL